MVPLQDFAVSVPTYVLPVEHTHWIASAFVPICHREKNNSSMQEALRLELKGRALQGVKIRKHTTRLHLLRAHFFFGNPSVESNITSQGKGCHLFNEVAFALHFFTV
jgi:hypothetical protein